MVADMPGKLRHEFTELQTTDRLEENEHREQANEHRSLSQDVSGMSGVRPVDRPVLTYSK